MVSSLFLRASVRTGVDYQVDHFQSTFPRAKVFQVIGNHPFHYCYIYFHIPLFQGGLALGTFASGGLSYLLAPQDPASKLFLVAGTAMFLVWPYTLVVIMPINHKLMDKKGLE